MRLLRTFTRYALCALIAPALTVAGLGFTPSRAGDASARIVTATQTRVDSLARELSLVAPGLDRDVLDLALQSQASAIHRGLVPDPSMLTVIDYSRPSIEPRLFVFDLDAKQLVFEELVAHGRNSGENLATEFSNVESSLQTSLGLFVTLDTYVGKHGPSLRLEGLEPGFNDRARSRAIVIHGADYVSPSMAARFGRIGRSWGCPALSRDSAEEVIDRIRGGSAVFAFYPDDQWLTASRFIKTLVAPVRGNDAFDGHPVAALEPHFVL